MAYKFNLIELESTALAKYKTWKTDMSHSGYRTEMFKAVEDLAYAILNVGKFDKYNIDFNLCSYEYALYLFERLITGSFRMEPRIPGTRFPLQEYVRQNIKHVVFTLRKDTAWQELITDMEFFLDDCQKPGDYEYMELADHRIEAPEGGVDKNRYAKKLLEALRVFYSFPEIRRLLAISLDTIYMDTKALVNPNIPADIRDFSITLVALSKRLTVEHNLNFGLDVPKNDLKKVFASSVRSTVFLSTIVNTDFFPRELLLSLDIDALYRLVHLVGGQTLKIPTIRELDSLLGAVVAVSKVIMEGKAVKESITEAKTDMKLMFANNINIQQFVSKSLESYNVFSNESKVEPLLNILAMSIKSMDHLFQQLTKRSEELNSSELLKKYVELSSSLSKFTESLIGISDKVKPKETAKETIKEIIDHQSFIFVPNKDGTKTKMFMSP